MNIVVCVKQVPDTHEVRIDPKTGTLIREGVPSIMNPDDKNALEEALRIKDAAGGAAAGKTGAGPVSVTVVSMGPPQAEAVLREALCMGADRAILVGDRAFAGADTLATSKTLSAVMRKLDYDIIFAGRQAIDGDTAQVGPEMAEHLGIPQVTYVEKVQVEAVASGEAAGKASLAAGARLRVTRATEEGHEEVLVGTPVLLTAIKELNQPRYMNIARIFASASTAVETWSAADLDVDKAEVGLTGSPTRVRKSQAKDSKREGVTVKEAPREAAERVAYMLREKRFI
jgi:electron transfer flavoprotein beta subunit